MNTFAFMTILYLIAVVLGISSVTILAILRIKSDGFYPRLNIVMLSAMVAFVISDYFCFRLPAETHSLYSELAGQSWGWTLNVFYSVIILSWILTLGNLTGKGTLLSFRWLVVVFVAYAVFMILITPVLHNQAATIIMTLFDAAVGALALYYLIVSIRHWNELKQRGLSVCLSVLLVGYSGFIVFEDIVVFRILEQKIPIHLPENPMVEMLILVDLTIIIYLFKADPLQLRSTRNDVQRLSSLCRRFSLTERESDVMAMICQGKSNPQIAEELFISESTVKRHLTSIYHKTDTTNRYELIVLFCQDSEVR